ncbi:InlB B-repeat-containing protein [Bifidobacterium pseudocatenulatum]|uniref:InlB B-repeat-containing protein n=1 Tax=Bifidobacterium pseudocatenulatum TaxID=28026 RepID=UPI001F0E3A9A|nr:InlB B-repeat-containing protein [Bifidobacterium pseudocatenulatum]MCH4840725.1 InlB B-repeat-containing protein [Bifidobacterium pseudocatenulatum]
MGFFTRLIAGLVAASTLGAGLAGTAGAVETNGAASDTTGTVTTTADDTGGRTVLDCRQSGEGATGPYADKFCWIDWSNLPLDSSGKPTPVRINVPGGHIDADATITHTDNAALAAKDFTGSKWSRLTSAYKLTGNTALAFSGRMGRQDPAASVTFSNVTPSADRTDTGVNVLKDFRLAFGDAEVMSGGVLQGHDVYEQTDIESDKTLEKLGMIGSGDPNQSYSKANTGYGTTHVTLAGGPKGATDDANKDSKGAAVVGAKQASRFKVSFGQVNQHWDGWGSAIAVGVYMPYLTAYPLTYDKNASDAAGEVPSNQRGKENTTQPAKTKTNGTVKTVADTNASLPDHLVNGDFSVNYHDQWKDSFNNWTSIDPNTGKTLHATSLPSGSSWKWTAINGWDKSKFGWTSTQKAGSNVQQKANAVELQYDDSTADNVYAELCAYEAGTAIYQDIKTVPGTLYKVRLKHASLNSTYLDKMQVMIGTPGHEQPVEMTRTSVNGHGDKLNEKSTTIATKVTNGNNRHHADQWETYEGTYLIPDGQTTTRFTFKSIDAKQLDYGNVLDDIVFDKAYRLSYDKNASDATGKVPSNQRGKENTVEPAKAKTTGTVKTVVDTSDGLPTELVNGDFEYPGADVLSQNLRDKKRNWWGVSRKDKMVYESDNPTKWVSLPSTFDSDRFAWDSSEAGKTSGVQEGSSQWHTNEVELQRDSRTGNMYAELSPYQAQSSIRQYIRTTPGTLYKVRLKHASLSSEYLDKMQVLIGADGNEQPVRMTRVESQNGLDATGESTASTTISTHASNKAEISWGSGLGYHSSRNHDGQWATYEGVYVATSDVTVFTFKSVDSPSYNTGNLLDDVIFTKAYKLTYDKNATDANGSVPSDETAGATKQVKSKANGSVRLASDDDVATYAASNLPEQIVNGSFDYPSVPSWTGLAGSSSNKNNKGKRFATINPGTGKYGSGCAMSTTGRAIPNWNRSSFAWNSTQGDVHYPGMSCEVGNVELNYDSVHHNQFAELTADQQGTAIYQDVKVTPGTMMKWSLKHSSATSAYVDKMQVMIGEPYKETAQEATRITSENGNKVGEKMTIISTPTTSDRADNKKWDTYSGTYLVPDGVTTVRFTFKSVASAEWYSGNDLDDIKFSRSYQLSYDKNAGDATGSVPSNQRGKENTVQPAEARATGTVKTVADGDSSKSLTVNPGFDVPDYSELNDGGLHWMYVSPAEGKAWSFYDYINPAQPRHQVAGLSQATFGWQELTGGDHKTTSFELHREKDGNVCADVHGSRTIGQTIDTQAGVAYTVSIRHSGRSKGNAGSVQVLVGPDKDHLRPLEMSRMNVSRTGAKYGDRIGKVGTVITTHSDSVDSTEGDHPAWDHSDDWETYSGTYVATGGQTVFAYRGVDKNGNAVSGNDADADSVIDDLSFKLAYPLSYDKNAQDATGGVPSSQYGKENTVEPTKAKITGRVGLAADKTASGLTVHDLKNGEIAPVQYGDFKFSTIDGVTADQITDVNGFTVKTNWNPTVENQAYAGTLLGTMYQPNKNGASLVLHHVGQWRDSSGTQRWLNAKITVNGQNLGSLVYYESQHKFLASYGKWDRHTSSRPYMDVTVDFLLDDGSTPQGLRGVTGFTDLDGGTSGYNEGVELVSGFDGAYVRSDAHLARFGTNGWAGATDENENNADAHGMKHYVGATFTGSSFHVRWSVASGQARGSGFQPVDSTIAYRLTYDKNAQDATGSIPSDTAANTTQPTKSETDGKVSDLVQRTTTHEDGSVTVRTVDQSTDVVSGCQVYYPAGQRITLATLAKDGDCWDSSMLTRPGHTQLGWSQDSQATQAQAEVTMVEGGMTVYAVWVGNPVLTYDTNKPNTWNGQMPSTPASVSVAYNTAAADGSGWQSGDLTKIKGYRFLGWYAGPQDDAGPYDWNTLLTGNVTVYAHWQRLQSNVVYDANGGTGSHANTTGWQYSDVTVPSDTSKSFKRDGYVFLGWDTQADGNGTAYKDGSQVPLQDKDITLYAQWQPVFEQFTPTGGVSLPLLVAGGVTLLVMGIGSTVMLTRRMRGEQ